MSAGFYDKRTIVNELKSNVCEIVFTKTDGTLRTMKCTLSPTYLPPRDLDESNRQRVEKDDLVVAWDVVNAGWRSFHASSVEDLQLVN